MSRPTLSVSLTATSSLGQPANQLYELSLAERPPDPRTPANSFKRNQLDPLGVGIAYDGINQQVTATRPTPAEWVVESYYNFTIFKALQVAPDIQLYISPALAPQTNLAAVFRCEPP